MISDDDIFSSYTQNDNESDVANTTGQPKDTTDAISNDTTTSTTSESTTEASEKTTITSATKHYDGLSPGQRGDDVMKMQKRLAQLGYILKVEKYILKRSCLSNADFIEIQGIAGGDLGIPSAVVKLS